MAKTVAIGLQYFEDIRTRNVFYVDKTNFIKEWWECGDAVTIIARPHLFGKTLNIDMLNCFFSNKYAGRSELFEGLSIWKEEKYRELQGTYPVIYLSFAGIRPGNYKDMKLRIFQILKNLYGEFDFIPADNYSPSFALNNLSRYLYHHFGKRPLIFLDEYDTPLQDAWLNGYWEEFSDFYRMFLAMSFKGNQYLERAVLTGFTGISADPVYSGLDHSNLATVFSNDYAEYFGFTENEVFAALNEYGLSDRKQEVKNWYDGFIFGKHMSIYNPWSIINYLAKKKPDSYWTNAISNSLADSLIRGGNSDIKNTVGDLILGKSVKIKLDQQVEISMLKGSTSAVWSMLIIGGYLKATNISMIKDDFRNVYTLTCTNNETRFLLSEIVEDWFLPCRDSYNNFLKALLANEVKYMNMYFQQIAVETFDSFINFQRSARKEAEQFYYAFALALSINLLDRYVLTSNRESGFGRYDIMLEPKNKDDNAYIIEFKVRDADDEGTLQDTVAAALAQIEEKKYDTLLIEKGVPADKIYKYGFAFEGKTVMIG